MTSSLAVLIWASCTIRREPCLCTALPRLVTAFLLRHHLRFSPWEKAPSRPARLCGNQSLSSGICLCNTSRANLQQQVLMPPEPCPGRGWEGTAAGTRLSKHPRCSCKSYLAPEHGCLSLPPRRQIAQQNCYAIAPSCESFTPNTFYRERRNREDITEAGHGDALTWWNCTCLERTTSRSCRQAPP